MRLAAALVLVACAAPPTRAADLQPETVRAFDQYIRETEARPQLLWVDGEPHRAALVRGGQVAIVNRAGRDIIEVPGGLIHDWLGTVFIPGATLAKTLALFQDYDHNKDHYQPEVLASRLISRNGNDFKIYLRLMKKKVITAILDTEYDVHYSPVDGAQCHSRAYSTRIAEVENAGRPDERTLPPGHDHGFLWRLNSYWSFVERDGGVYVECEAVSLTRSIPAGLGWLVQPIIRSLPRESLESTLRETRTAVRSIR